MSMWFLLFIGLALLTAALFLNPKLLYIGEALVSFGIYFGLPQDNLLLYLVFVLGIVLLVIELYVPDFGIIGLIGFIAMIIALYYRIGDSVDLLLMGLASLTVAVVVAIVLLKMGKQLNISPMFILETSMNKESGYSSERDLSFLKDQVGVAMTDLRPVGRAKFEEKIYDVISTEEMIPNSAVVFVERVQGSKVYVRRGELDA